MNPETILQSQIRLALGRETDFTLWRNTTGMAEHVSMPAVGAPRRYKQRFGLAVGGSDLIGILEVYPFSRAPLARAAPIGRFVALEVKTPRGRVTPEQADFLALVRRRGGFACVVRSVDDAVSALARARTGAVE